MKKKLYVIAIIIALVMSFLVVNVNAAEKSFSTSLKASSTNVEKGKEFTINIKVSNINVGDKGINSLEGYISFDDKVFEDISSDNVEGLNDCNVTYKEDSGKLQIKKVGFIKSDSDICQITLKTKSSTDASKGTIELKDIVASNSESEISTDDVSLEISIGSGNSSSDGNSIKISSTNRNTNNTNNNATLTLNRNNNNTNNNTNTNTNTEEEPTQTIQSTNRNNTTNNSDNTSNINNRNVNNSNTNNENKSTDEEMPNTGIDDTIVKAILLVGLVGALGYIKLKSLDK